MYASRYRSLAGLVLLLGIVTVFMTACVKPTAALQPAALGQGQCQASEVGSEVYAQLAVSGTTCATLDAVVQGAVSAHNRSYTSDGFSCTATREGAGSPWAPAWSGTYYAYSCINGSEQVAFTWGPASQYVYGSRTA